MNDAVVNKRFNARSICLMAMFLAFLVVGSWITIDTGLLKFTLQILVIFLIGLFFNLKESMIIILTYVLLGLIGLPFFSNFGGGFAYAINPTFGFVYGFIPGLVVMYLFKHFLTDKVTSKKLKIVYQTLSCLSCLLIVYIFGFIHGYIILNFVNGKALGFGYLMSIFIVPYIPFDILKIVVAIVSYNSLGKYLYGGAN